MIMEFVEFFERLEDFGMTDALLPFLLIFVILFAMLQKTKILGEGKKNFNVIVAAIVALLVVIPHVTNSYPPDRDVVDIINSSLPQVSMVMIAIIMALLLIGLMGGEATWLGGSLSGWIAILAFLIVIYVFGGSMGFWEDKFGHWWGSDTTSVVIIILIFAIVVWYITRDADADKATKGLSLVKQFGDMFKKS
jgi:hypothetical protein